MAAVAALDLLLYLFWISLSFFSGSLQLCIEKERKALLSVRSGFPDLDRRLSPWKGDECCSWEGVGCNNITGHVIKLDLSFGYPLQSGIVFNRSEVDPSLFHLKHLEYLDISHNRLYGHQIPSSIGSLTRLQNLDLSLCGFKGEIPYELGNLSDLRYLSLFQNNISGQIPASFVHLRNLQFLDLSRNSISGEIPENIGNLRNIESLYLADNQIEGVIPKSLGNLSKLSWLNISDNRIVGGLPETIGNLTALVGLNVSVNQIDGKIPDSIRNLFQLQFLFLFDANINGSIPGTLGSLCNLMRINLYGNDITGELDGLFEQLSMCKAKKLRDLNLGSNQLSGSVPTSLGKLSSLRFLTLYSNNLVGDIREAHFANLTNLKLIDISDSNLSVKVSQDWLPPFQARYILMNSCNLGPRFPLWLQNQTSLYELNISNNGIAGVFPDWFWSFHLSNMAFVFLSNNKLNGNIPSSICTNKELQIVDLADNDLSGTLPVCWGNLSSLAIFDVSNNKLSGSIPRTFGFMATLQSLHMKNNGLSGTIPSTLQNCNKLVNIDLSWNKLFGGIPKWFGRISTLQILILRSNNFTGAIPSQLSLIPTLRVLDLSHNNLFGSLPSCFGMFRSMMTSQNEKKSVTLYVGPPYFMFNYIEDVILTVKDLELPFTTLLPIVTHIDLSNNNLSGDIPKEITNLHGLRFLNLSSNHFSGNIPDEIGLMSQLESLDLSKNNLSGRIPSSISTLNFLGTLDLSYNNLTGKIPMGTQLQTFTNLSYVGNPRLCGEPLQTKCPGDDPTIDDGVVEDQGMHKDDEYGKFWYFIGFAPGFVFGFWGFMGAVMIKKSTRIKYILLIDRIIGWVMHLQWKLSRK